MRETIYAIGDECTINNSDKWEKQPGRSFRNPGFSQDVRPPVVCVSWDDAKAFVAWLVAKTGKPYRLLTEAERE
jgi:formylglycine-generating enzyme required for sulfatase activity